VAAKLAAQKGQLVFEAGDVFQGLTIERRGSWTAQRRLGAELPRRKITRPAPLTSVVSG
jgi:hypothetical protein